MPPFLTSRFQGSSARKTRSISLDTETTGVDLYHGCKAFFITVCGDDDQPECWEWPVDPLTRQPQLVEEEVLEIRDVISNADELILHNAKFDYAALRATDPRMVEGWDWSKVRDTLMAGHLLNSGSPHNLTDMAVMYLRRNIEKFELKLGVAVKKARGIARRKHPLWRIARVGLPEMPSARSSKAEQEKGTESNKPWKADTWLLKALRLVDLTLPEGWDDLLYNYAAVDSQVTFHLWSKLWRLIQSRNLEAIYEESLRLLPVVSDMETRGVSVSGVNLEHQVQKYGAESEENARYLVNDADSLGYNLTLPKSGVNVSLRELCFGVDGETHGPLELPIIKKTKKGNPSLGKEARKGYLEMFDPDTMQHIFMRRLMAKQDRDTAVNYMRSYQRFWLPLRDDNGDVVPGWWVLHPNLNPTGTNTLRFSCSNPNEQNISKRDGFNVRYCFAAPPGYERWSFDFENLELRIPFYKCGQKELIELFERPNDPPFYGSNHLLNFSVVYPDIWAKVVKEVGLEKAAEAIKSVPELKDTWYRRCKNGGFAIQYGAGPATADRAFGRDGCHALLKSRFTKLEELNQWCVSQANRQGYIETMPDRSIDPDRGYPIVCSRGEYGRIKPTIPLSYFVQGTAMWLTRRGMIRVDNQLKEWRQRERTWDGYIEMQVHDELDVMMKCGEFPPNHPKYGKTRRSNLWRARVIQRLMSQGGVDIGVPTPVGVTWHPDNWSKGIDF